VHSKTGPEFIVMEHALVTCSRSVGGITVYAFVDVWPFWG